MKIKQLVLVVSSVLIITGCFDDNTPPVYEDVEGVVLSNGEPLSNVDVHIRNHFDPGGFVIGESDRNGLNVTIQLQSKDLITGHLYKNRGLEPIATFFEDTLDAGERTINIPDSLLANGILAYDIRNSSRQLATNLILVTKPDSMLPGRLPFTKTDANGEFILKAESISVGQSFRTSVGGFEVTENLELIITEGENILAKRKVRVLPDQSNYFEIIID